MLKLEAERYLRNHDLTGLSTGEVTDAVAMCIIAAMADDSNDRIARGVYTMNARRMNNAGFSLASLRASTWTQYFGYPEQRQPGFHQGLVERYVRAVDDWRLLDATALLTRSILTGYVAVAVLSGPFTRWFLFRRLVSSSYTILARTLRALATSASASTIGTWSTPQIRIQITPLTAGVSSGGP